MHHGGSHSRQDEARRQLSAWPAPDTDGPCTGGQNDWTQRDVSLEDSGPMMNSSWLCEEVSTRKHGIEGFSQADTAAVLSFHSIKLKVALKCFDRSDIGCVFFGVTESILLEYFNTSTGCIIDML